MAQGKIHIGTSGWSYKDWKGVFYPEKMKSTDWLSFYAAHFDITEINMSFYHLPTEKTVVNWVDKVPAHFKFCPKMSRYLTHMKKLNEPEEPLQRFFEVFSHAQKYLGPILIQLPPSLKYNEEVARNFFELLKHKYHTYSFALEVRHTSWMEQSVIKLLEEYDIAFVISQSGVNFPYAEFVTSKNIYIRFHGPKELYASLYSEETMKEYGRKIKKWARAGHDVWAFFNNDWYTYGIQNAKQLIEFTK